MRMDWTPGRLDYSNVSLTVLIARAFRVKPIQISGPAWFDTERFDIVAKIPGGTPKDQVPEMLQTLLVERFHMEVRRESRDQPVFALLVDKNGPKLTKSEEDSSAPLAVSGLEARRGNRDRPMVTAGNGRLEAHRVTLGALANLLSASLRRPVLDQTGIVGTYDVKLEAAPEDVGGAARSARMTVPGNTGIDGVNSPATALAGFEPVPGSDELPSGWILASIRRLGLRLEARRASIEHIVIEKAQKTPSEN
jgi:uncharacterized protein (TIGR03435 family)